MAYILRLILLACVAFFSAQSNAATLYQNCKGQGYDYGDLKTSLLPAGHYWAYYDEFFLPTNTNCKQVNGWHCPNNQSYKAVDQCVAAPKCADNEVLKDGVCVARSDPVAEFCAALPGAQYSNQEVVTGSSAPPSVGCTPTMYVDQTTRGCGGTFQREFSAQHDGKWYHYGTLTLTGGTCNLVEGATGENPDGTTPTDAAPPADDRKCPNGFPGTVNGIETCVPYSGQNGVGVSGGTTTTTNPDGSTTTTTTQGQTSCTGASCTTTTTTTTTTGGGTPSTTTTSTTTTRNEFCRKNPTDPVCTGSATGGDGGGDGNGDEEASSFGGSCGAWTCEGDAIQCAIAREQHQRNCKLLDEPPDSVYAAAADGSDGISADKLKSEAQQVSVGSFDSSGFGWGSSCPADPSIPLNFGGISAEFSIPFSRICGPLGVLSMAGVGITLLGSMVWVLGGRNNRG
ncbi:hypothetical protein [Diaphorobacter sp. LR2014-1]|uniref:hypothetical protein n=1 Tax=Diaphorobacter sp. LR2014-1 TaxID=1933219 RepID=UPI0011AF3FCF|nr:hypothetical protein [Diaphorobacter sp. LR2014-1]